MGLPVGGGRGMRLGGGIGGLVVVLLVLVLQTQLGGGDAPPGPDIGNGSSTSPLRSCRTGEDANRGRNCAIVADVNSIQAFWTTALPEQAGRRYTPAVTTIFTGGVSTECGAAPAQVGPFYCSKDRHVYLDPTFFEEMLEGRLGAEGGLFSEAYVLAHEYGHHVQDLLGTLSRVRTREGPDSDAVRLELQADCYAGMWAGQASEVPDEGGEPFIRDLSDRDVANALDAARAVGDDRIQERSTGQVDPDQWTHGSAEQRTRWFTIGLERGTLPACDTFAADRL